MGDFISDPMFVYSLNDNELFDITQQCVVLVMSFWRTNGHHRSHYETTRNRFIMLKNNPLLRENFQKAHQQCLFVVSGRLFFTYSFDTAFATKNNGYLI